MGEVLWTHLDETFVIVICFARAVPSDIGSPFQLSVHYSLSIYLALL